LIPSERVDLISRPTHEIFVFSCSQSAILATMFVLVIQAVGCRFCSTKVFKKSTESSHRRSILRSRCEAKSLQDADFRGKFL
jgi:uncharacterized membrane protein